MKRLFVFVDMAAAASSSFAYHDYGYSRYKFEMSDWLTFMCIVMIIWGVLEFFVHDKHKIATDSM